MKSTMRSMFTVALIGAAVAAASFMTGADALAREGDIVISSSSPIDILAPTTAAATVELTAFAIPAEVNVQFEAQPKARWPAAPAVGSMADQWHADPAVLIPKPS